MNKGGRGVPWPHTGKREGGRLFQAAGPAKAKQSLSSFSCVPGCAYYQGQTYSSYVDRYKVISLGQTIDQTRYNYRETSQILLWNLDDDFVDDVGTVEVEVQSIIRLHSLDTTVCHHPAVLQPARIITSYRGWFCKSNNSGHI